MMSSRAEALKELLIEVTRVHFHVGAATRAISRPGDLSNAQVSVLRSLAERGPSTVPELARERAIARQPVQRTVIELQGLSLVRLEPNPKHRRSMLVALTRTGRRHLDRMEARQLRWLEHFGERHSERGIRAASRLLRSLREELAKRAHESGRKP